MTCIVVKFLRTLRTQSTLIPWLQRHLVPPTKDSLTKCLLGERLPRSHKKTHKSYQLLPSGIPRSEACMGHEQSECPLSILSYGNAKGHKHKQLLSDSWFTRENNKLCNKSLGYHGNFTCHPTCSPTQKHCALEGVAPTKPQNSLASGLPEGWQRG